MAVCATRTVLLIMGMPDNASRERIVGALEAVDGVLEVDVNLHRGRAAIVHASRCDLEALVGAAVRAGFGVALLGTMGRSGGVGPSPVVRDRSNKGDPT